MKDKNKHTQDDTVIEHDETSAPGATLDVPTDAGDDSEAEEERPTPRKKKEMVKFDYKLANGITVPLRAPKHQKDFPMEALLYTKRNDNVEFMFAVLTPDSLQVLRMADATIEDFEGMCQAYGVAIGAIEEE